MSSVVRVCAETNTTQNNAMSMVRSRRMGTSAACPPSPQTKAENVRRLARRVATPNWQIPIAGVRLGPTRRSVLGRPLDAVDHEDVDGPPSLFDAQAQLLLQDREYGHSSIGCTTVDR